MHLTSRSLENGGLIPGRCAFAVQDPKKHLRLSQNRNPQLSWYDVPAGTKSFVVLCTDADAPTKADDVNREGRTVDAELPRAEFAHWALVDVPADVRQIAEGACSSAVTAKGKSKPSGPEGSRQGQNDYTGWFKGDKVMEGSYLGYDGPCPPWNDARAHRYTFEVIATDLEKCPVQGAFTVKDVRKALEGHVLASAKLTARYSLNPAVKLNATLTRLMRKPMRARGRKLNYKAGGT